MKKGFFKKLCTVIVTAALAVCSLSVAAFAEGLFTTEPVITSAEDLKSIRKWWLNSETFDATGSPTKDLNTINLDSQGYYTATYVADDNKFKSVTISGATTANNVGWDDLETSEQTKLTQEMVKTVSNWKLSQSSQKKIQNQLLNSASIPFTNADAVASLFNQGADITGAMSWFAPFSGPVGIILGVGVVIIMVLLIFTTVMDLVYIGIPMAQVAMNNAANKGGNGGGDDKHPFGVSVDAVKVVEESANSSSGNGGGNVYFKYFKRRIITYIILALCILYLISGSLGGLIGNLLNLVSGITGGN